jgi:phosphoglycolate phosphatase
MQRMPRQFDLLIFDWDGTLMDSAALIVESIQSACADLGFAVPDDRACRHIIGLGLVQALQTLLPDLAEAMYPALVDRYRQHYLGRDAQLPLFEGVGESLAELRETGFALAVATGKSQAGLQRALQHHDLGAHFVATRCADQTHSKPHPAMVLELLEETGTLPGRALVIGDTAHDMQMAAQAGVARLAVTYGAHRREDLTPHAPLALLDDYRGVHAWLCANA